MAEVVDLLDSDEELALPLAARLAAAAKREAPARPQASQERAPLASLHNQQDSGGAAADGATLAAGRPNSPVSRVALAANASLGAADVLSQRQAERAARKAARAAAAAAGGGGDGLLGPLSPFGALAAVDPEPRPQYHQQEQRQEEEQQEPALGGNQQPARRGPMRGAGSGGALHKQYAAAWEPALGSEGASPLQAPYSQQRGMHDAMDEEWQPPASSQGARRQGGAAAAAAAGGGAGQPPAKKGGRRPKRTAEEIARDKEIQVRLVGLRVSRCCRQ